MAAAKELAQALAKSDYALVYGGGNGGLMGEVARTMVQLRGSGSVRGIIPDALLQYERSGRCNEPEIEHRAAMEINGGETQSSTEPQSGSICNPDDHSTFGQTIVVQTMHIRKETMARAVTAGGPGSGFVALPGGFGTLEELMEMTTWSQLGIHDRPVVLYNVDGFWDPLLAWLRSAVDAGFITAASGRGIIIEARSADEVLQRLKEYSTPVDGRLKLDWSANEA